MSQSWRFWTILLVAVCLSVLGLLQTARSQAKITIAAASDLTFPMTEIVALFQLKQPQAQVQVVYGSSGRFFTQIQQGAPYDLYFSADIDYPYQLKDKGFAGSVVSTYAIGRLVLWYSAVRAHPLTLQDLSDPAIRKIAIANPQHAPYGKRAAEALKAAGIWPQIQSKLVYGENVSQAAQFVQSGNADVGIIALSLALSPQLKQKGRYTKISDKLHTPLEQGFIVTKRAAQNPSAHAFSRFMQEQAARQIMHKYRFVLPKEQKKVLM